MSVTVHVQGVDLPRESFPDRDVDCRYGCCLAGDVGLCSEAVPEHTPTSDCRCEDCLAYDASSPL